MTEQQLWEIETAGEYVPSYEEQMVDLLKYFGGKWHPAMKMADYQEPMIWMEYHKYGAYDHANLALPKLHEAHDLCKKMGLL